MNIVLDLDTPALVALISLAKLEEPEKELTEAIDIVVRKADNEVRKELLTMLVALIEDERLVEMIQEQLKKEDYLMNSLFLQKIRDEERNEGRDEHSYEIAKGMKEKGLSVRNNPPNLSSGLRKT